MVGNILSLHKPSLQSPEQRVTTQAEHCELCARGLAEGLRLGAVGRVTRAERKGRRCCCRDGSTGTQRKGLGANRRKKAKQREAAKPLLASRLGE